MPKRVSWPQAVARRLQRNGLSSPLISSPADITAAMCGAHAQILSAAELSLAIRSSTLSRADIREALWQDHKLIKTIGPRGTVHLLPASDLPLWIGALSAIPGPGPNFHKETQLTPDRREELIAAIGDALQDAELTLAELDQAVVSRVGKWAGDLVIPAFQTYWPRWRQVIGNAAFRGLLCFGPNRGRNVTYTNPRRWYPKLKPADTRTAPREAIKLYLRAYGPARPEHFARWFAAPLNWVASVFDSLGDELERLEMDGLDVWIVAGDSKFHAEAHNVRLLPYFDAYAIASHPREWLYPGRAAQRAMARGQAGNFPVLLIDGVVAGVWHLQRSGRKVVIRIEALGRLTATQRRELEFQVVRIGEFLESEPTLTIGKVTAGPHA